MRGVFAFSGERFVQLDHISLGVTDVQRSAAFFDSVLAPLGYVRLWSDADAAGFGVPGTDEAFAIKLDASGNIAANARTHIAFHAATREAVVSFYEAAMDRGAATDGVPELHPMYGEGYFAAFVFDPDGYRLEAVCHEHTMQPEFVLDHVQLAMPAGEEQSARRFYADVLGFEEVEKLPELAQRGGTWFRAGVVKLHLGVDADFIPAIKAHPALRCTKYAKLVERLAAHGVHVSDDPLLFEGKRHCYIADPFGNRIELIEA